MTVILATHVDIMAACVLRLEGAPKWLELGQGHMVAGHPEKKLLASFKDNTRRPDANLEPGYLTLLERLRRVVRVERPVRH